MSVLPCSLTFECIEEVAIVSKIKEEIKLNAKHWQTKGWTIAESTMMNIIL